MFNLRKPSDIGNLVRDKFLKYEFLFILVIALTYLSKLLKLSFPLEIVFILFTIIALIYFFSAFQIPEKTSLRAFDLLFVRICAISSSVVVMGILYSFLKMPEYKEMLLVGTISLLLSLLYILFTKFKNQVAEIFSVWVIVRCLLLITISIALFWNTLI